MRILRPLLLGLLALIGTAAFADDLPANAPKISASADDDNATWYYIMNGDSRGYLSADYVTTYNSVDNVLSLSNTTRPTDDAGLWCVVAVTTDDSGTAYYIYNKKEKKVLGMSNSNSDSSYDDNSCGSLYDLSALTDESTVCVKFDFKSNGYTMSPDGAVFCGIAETGTDYNLNYRSGHSSTLGLWNVSVSSRPNASGNAFYFIDQTTATSREDALAGYAELQSFAPTNALDADFFNYDTEAVNKLVSDYPLPTSFSDGAGTTYKNNVEAAIAKIKEGERQNTIISAGAEVFIENVGYQNYYVYDTSNKGNNQLGYTTDKTWRTVFRILSKGEGHYMLYIPYLKKYVGGLPTSNNTCISLVDDESSAGEWEIGAVENRSGCCYVKAVDASSDVPQYWHEPSWSGVVRWNLMDGSSSINASTFILKKANSQEETWCNSLLSTVNADASVIEGSYIGYKPSNETFKNALTALTATHNGENYRDLEDAYNALEYIKPDAKKWYVIRNAKSQDNVLYENYSQPKTTGGTDYELYCGENTTPAVLWRFEEITYTRDGETTERPAFKIYSANSGKVMSKANWGYGEMKMLEISDADYGIFDLYEHDYVDTDHAVALRDKAHDGTACVGYGSSEPTGVMKSWNMKGHYNNFYIEEATEIPVAISSVGYATLNLRFAVNIPTDVAAYIGEENDSYVALTAVEGGVLPADTPVILEDLKRDGQTAHTYKFPIVYDEVTKPTDCFFGTYDPQTVDDGYILKNGSQGLGMYLLNGTDKTVSANKAYLSGSGTAAAKALRFGGSGEDTTGLGSISADANKALPAVYDLRGRRVAYPTRGIYVTASGEKIFVK